MGRPREHDEETRQRLLDAAEELLSEGGASAFSVRKVAQRAGTTTRAVYSLFDDKQGLVSALYVRTFELLMQRFDDFPPNPERPVEGLVETGLLVFRDFSREHPNLFRLVFERLIPEFREGELELRTSLASLERLRERVAACVRPGSRPGLRMGEATLQFHALCQGLASLELRGWLYQVEDEERFWREALRRFARGLTTDR